MKIEVMWALALSVLLVAAPAFAQTDGKDPDKLYADREQLSSARQAADIWDARLTANQKDFESAWKLARAAYWLGGHVPADEQRQQFERGIKAATRATERGTSSRPSRNKRACARRRVRTRAPWAKATSYAWIPIG